MTEYSGDIAIVGMAGLYPDAPDIDVFWENVLSGHDAVREAPPEWLNGADMLDPESSELLKIYTTKGGFLGDLARFDARAFGTMPFSVEGAQPDQFLALKTCHDALEDAGYGAGRHDHTRTGVILGHSIHVHRANTNGVQQFWFNAQMREFLAALFPGAAPDQVRAAVQMMQDRLPKISAESIPGLVPNILTGRIANRLDLMGPNFVIDAACSSSLIAADLAMTELRAGRADLMLAGGVNTTTSPLVYGVFCGVEALSRSGTIRPFSAEANGTVLGEGAGVVALKRLEDALTAEDRIYAVIKAVGQSSDGKSSGLMAPRFEGEVLAMQRAYAQSGIDPATIGLIEAHGTGIPLGDRTEIAAMRDVFGGRRGLVPDVPVGSVKSMIGHCIPAAGSAAIIKNALALSHHVIPPSLCERVNGDLGLEDTPFHISSDARPWIHNGKTPRRAAINAFGFGGVNAHMILEEAPGGVRPDVTAAFLRPSDTRYTEAVFVLAAPADDIPGSAERLAERAKNADPMQFAALSRETWQESGEGTACLTVVAGDPAELGKKLATACRKLADGEGHSWQTRNGICFEPAPVEGKVAFLFPGEMAQYPAFMQDAFMAFPEMEGWFGALSQLFDGDRELNMRDLVFPPPNGISEETRNRLSEALHQVDYGSELVFAADQAVHGLLRSLGIEPQGMLGHSTGENAALVASGRLRLDRDATLGIIAGMNRAFDQVQSSGAVPQGTLLTVAGLPRPEFLGIFERYEDVHFTMDNCPNQAIVFGARDRIDALESDLVAAGAVCTRLPISWGYHTEYVAPMARDFAALFDGLELAESPVELYSCATAAPFPDTREAFVKTALAQYVSRVRFTEAIERLYEDGYRIFLECGPNATLSAFVRDILDGRPHIVEAADNRRRGMVSQLRHLVARLRSAGICLPYPDQLNPEATPDQARRSRARAAHAAAPFLPNALPFVRLDREEAAAIRTLLGAEGSPGPELRNTAPAPAPVRVAGQAAQRAVHEHMGMMRDFLRRQERVAHAAIGGTVRGSGSTDDDPIALVDIAQYFDLPFAVRGYVLQGTPSLQQVMPSLAPDERDEAQRMSSRADAWSGWALSRIAAKRAARIYLSDAGVTVTDSEVAIRRTGAGVPYLDVGGLNGTAPSVTLSYEGSSGAACIASPAWRIGLGIDYPSRVRDPGDVLARLLGPDERARLTLRSDAATASLVRCIKSAAAKTLGVGPNGQPTSFQILDLVPEQGRARVAHGDTTIDTRLAQIGAGLCVLGFVSVS